MSFQWQVRAVIAEENEEKSLSLLNQFSALLTFFCLPLFRKNVKMKIPSRGLDIFFALFMVI